MTAERTPEVIQAEELVAKWSKEYRAYLKDGGGNAHAVHPAASAALIDHIAQALTKQKEALKESPIAALVEAHKGPRRLERVAADAANDRYEIESNGKIKQTRPRKAKAATE